MCGGRRGGIKGLGSVRNLRETLAEPGFRWGAMRTQQDLKKKMDGMELYAMDMLDPWRAGGPPLTPG